MEEKHGATTAKVETRKEGFDLGSKCPRRACEGLNKPLCRMWFDREV